MKRPLLIALYFIFALAATADNRTISQMKEIASKKLSMYANGNSVTRTTQNIVLIADEPTLSVFADQNGYVIVSRDKRFPEVLAYGMGDFNMEEAPANVRWWYENIQKSLETCQTLSTRSYISYQPVAPMLTTKWGQNTPYNNYAPTFTPNKVKAPIGCVAVSMGQVMNFNQYPASAKFTGSYMLDGENEQHIVEVNSTYRWPYLLAYNDYIDDNGKLISVLTNPGQSNMVAALLRDCGYSVNMNYSVSGSGAIAAYAADALVNCFGYPEDAVKYRNRQFYTDEEWENMIYGELQKGFPIIYNGNDANGGGGHSFVAHGMDGNGLLYINWGWNGMYDGYYEYRLLNPNPQQFSLQQDIIFGIRKEALESDNYESMLGGELYSFDYDNAKGEFIVNSKGFYNYGGLDIIGRIAVVAENQTTPNKSVYIDFMEQGDTLGGFWGFGQFTEKINITFPKGQYHLYIASLDQRETNWQPVRTITDGAIYYGMEVDSDGTVTIGKTTNEFATAVDFVKNNNAAFENNNAPIRYYDLQGREVDSSAKGLIIVRQGDMVKKVIRH